MWLRIILASMATVLVAACTSDADPTAVPEPTSTPTARPVRTPVPPPPPVDDAGRLQAASVLQRFGGEAAVIATDWDAFRDGFDAWRRSLEGCSEADRRADLRAWVVDFQAVSLAVTSLDFPSGTATSRDVLTAALALEEQGLRELRDEWTPDSDQGFASYGQSRTQAAIRRQEARSHIVELIAIAESGDVPTPEPPAPPPPGIPPGALPPPPPEGPLAGADALGTFKATLEGSDAGWDAFHRRYDDWRRSDGGCAHGDVRVRLATFASEFGAVLGRVNTVVRPSVVRPLAEQLIEAAVDEAAGLAALRDSWVAYDSRPWRAYDGTRRAADGLRRQVRSSLDELNLEFDISPP